MRGKNDRLRYLLINSILMTEDYKRKKNTKLDKVTAFSVRNTRVYNNNIIV